MLNYGKNNVWDCLLCATMITGLCANILQGFYLPEHLQTNIPAIALFAAGLCAVFFLCAYNNKTIVFSLVFLGISVALAVAYMQAGGLASVYIENTESNELFFFFLIGLVSLTVFLLSRSRAGALVLAVLGSLCICAVVFLEFKHFFSGFLAYLGASLCMCFYRNYRYHALNTRTIKVDFARFAAISVAATAAILCLSVFISVALIQPLHLPTLELKLIMRYLSFEILEHSAVSSRIILPDDEQKSSVTDDSTKTTRNPGAEDKDKTEYRDVYPAMQEKDTSTLNFSNLENFLNAVRYTLRDKPPFYLAAIPFIAIILSVMGKIGLRRLWYAKTLRKDRRRQVIDFYLFYLKKLEVLSYKRLPADTPSEFAAKIQDKVSIFTTDAADIVNLTEVFVKANYGGLTVSDSECELFLSFYKSFYRNCRDKLGTWRYCLKFFAL